jgi:SAM-dependent methyltransferase
MKKGVSFESTLTLGHLGSFIPTEIVEEFFREYAVVPSVDREALAKKEVECNGYSDWFFHAIGAKKLSFLDFSDYEQANIVHDLNLPIPEELKERFDVVVDGGTLEHVFNYPQALSNAMQLVKVGGHLILDQPVNSCSGHGFYQICPEVFFRALTKENGFDLLRLVVCEDFPDSQWYEVIDPMEAGARVTLATQQPVHALVLAKKVDSFHGFGSWPAQADYQRSWERKESTSLAPGRGRKKVVLDAIRSFAQALSLRRYWRFSVIRNYKKGSSQRKLTNREHFKPVSE